jgi:hypothetical protein
MVRTFLRCIRKRCGWVRGDVQVPSTKTLKQHRFIKRLLEGCTSARPLVNSICLESSFRVLKPIAAQPSEACARGKRRICFVGAGPCARSIIWATGRSPIPTTPHACVSRGQSAAGGPSCGRLFFWYFESCPSGMTATPFGTEQRKVHTNKSLSAVGLRCANPTCAPPKIIPRMRGHGHVLYQVHDLTQGAEC